MSLADELAVPPKAGERAGITLNGDGSGQITTGPLTEAPDWSALLRVWNLDPDTHRIIPGTVQMRAWDGQTVDGLQRFYYYKAGIELNVDNPAGAPLLAPVTPANIRPTRMVRKVRADGWETALIVPDSQHGGRVINGEVYPFHDDRALDLTIQFNATRRPAQVVFLGDMLDFPTLSSFEQEPTFASLKYGFQALYEYFAQMRADNQYGRFVWLKGNHELRLGRWLTNNAPQLLGLTRVGDTTPVLSIRSLLRLDELDIEFVDAYPNGQHFINPRLRAIHGHYSTVAKLKAESHVSTLCGHLHRVEMMYDTRYPNGVTPRQYVYASIGCTCRVDGHVPSTNSGNGDDQMPAPSRERWQQAFGVVEYEPAGVGNEAFTLTPVLIHDGLARYDGVTYRTRVA